MIFDRIAKTQLSLDHASSLWHTLNFYYRGFQLQEAGKHKEAVNSFLKAIEMGEKLVAFLFQNVDEGVFVITEGYIFDYLQALIADARDREEMLRTK